MPELPETETVARVLRSNIVGHTVQNVKIIKGYKISPTNKTFAKSVINKKVVGVQRVAKNIIIKFENNVYVQTHLAMTGRLLLKKSGDQTSKWLKWVFVFENSTRLEFHDMRAFGKTAVLTKKEFDDLTNKYGPEPLDNKINAKAFLKQLLTKKTSIKNALMDQKIISGLGNIYATDALFMAQINPKTKTDKLSLEQATDLLKSSREILNEGIKNRGATLPDKMYVDPLGKSGKQQKHFRIYQKKECPICKHKVKYEKINGRGTYFCPSCQKP